MKKGHPNYNYAITLAMLPIIRFLDKHFPKLYMLLAVGICLYFLLRGLYYHLMESEGGRAFLRRLPFLKVPEEDTL